MCVGTGILIARVQTKASHIVFLVARRFDVAHEIQVGHQSQTELSNVPRMIVHGILLFNRLIAWRDQVNEQ